MPEKELRGRKMMGKTVVSQDGRKFGLLEDVSFITESGELMNVVISDPTKHSVDMDLQTDEQGRYLIPFSAVQGVGDFVIVSENDII